MAGAICYLSPVLTPLESLRYTKSIWHFPIKIDSWANGKQAHVFGQSKLWGFHLHICGFGQFVTLAI